MFITLKYNNCTNSVRLDEISVYSIALSGNNLATTSYFYRLKDGSEWEIDFDCYEKIKNALGESGETLEELPNQVNHKPSEIGAFLTQLHNLLGGRGEAKLTTDRKARLMSRMKDFSKEELILAATNLGSDEYMQGGNDSGKRWGNIDYLIRTSTNVNKWLEDQPEKKKTGMF